MTELSKYTITEPIELSPFTEERKAQLKSDAPLIREAYLARRKASFGDSSYFNSPNFEDDIENALHASRIVYALSGEKKVGLLAYKIHQACNDANFFNQTEDALKGNPELLKAFEKIVCRGGVFSTMEKIALPGTNGISDLMIQKASVCAPENLVYVGDIQSNSIYQRFKIRDKLGQKTGVTFWAGEILEVDKPLPFDLSPEQFVSFSLAFARAFAAENARHTIADDAGETAFDNKGILASDSFYEKAGPLDYKGFRPEDREFAYISRVAAAMDNILSRQAVSPDQIFSAIATTVVQSPKL